MRKNEFLDNTSGLFFKDKKILIVDDDKAILKNLERTLKNVFSKIVVANSGSEALACLKKEAFAVIISDYKMPNGDGLAFLKEVNEKYNIPVIMMTGEANKSLAIEFANNKVFKIIEKPFDQEKLFENLFELSKILEINSKNEKLLTVGAAVSTIIHEINNPLAVMIMKCQLLIDREETDLSIEKMLDGVKIISKYGDRVNDIIKKTREFILDNKIPVYEKKSFYLSEVIEEIKNLVASKKCRDIHFDFTKIQDNSSPISFEFEILMQCVINLVNNSIKALSSSTGEKWVKVEVQYENSVIRLLVCDSGPGIPMAKQKNLFQQGFSTGSTGLGLNLSRRLLESKGAKLYFDSDSPQTLFVIEIPS
jgi:signal transduction histidine kinase